MQLMISAFFAYKSYYITTAFNDYSDIQWSYDQDWYPVWPLKITVYDYETYNYTFR